MPSDAAPILRDMGHHIALATQLVEGLDYEAFRNDIRTVFAVTRCLEIISEASRRLPDEMKARYRAIAGRTWPAPATSTGMITRMSPRSWYGTPYNWPWLRKTGQVC
jgi:ribonuclease HepT-like protein